MPHRCACVPPSVSLREVVLPVFGERTEWSVGGRGLRRSLSRGDFCAPLPEGRGVGWKALRSSPRSRNTAVKAQSGREERGTVVSRCPSWFGSARKTKVRCGRCFGYSFEVTVGRGKKISADKIFGVWDRCTSRLSTTLMYRRKFWDSRGEFRSLTTND